MPAGGKLVSTGGSRARRVCAWAPPASQRFPKPLGTVARGVKVTAFPWVFEAGCVERAGAGERLDSRMAPRPPPTPGTPVFPPETWVWGRFLGLWDDGGRRARGAVLRARLCPWTSDSISVTESREFGGFLGEKLPESLIFVPSLL